MILNGGGGGGAKNKGRGHNKFGFSNQEEGETMDKLLSREQQRIR